MLLFIQYVYKQADMTYGLIFIVILLKASRRADSYFVSTQSSVWRENYNNCSIASPPLRYTNADIYVEINSSLIDGDDAWVGYIKAQRSFDYIGCFKQNSSNLIRPENVEVGSLGLCFNLCNHSSLLGISVNECFCIKDISSLVDLPSNDTKCTTECGDQSGVACGGQTENGTKYLSVYKDTQIEEKFPSDVREDAYCLRLDRHKDIFGWRECAKEMLVFCDFNGTCIPTSSTGTNGTWIENANLCFKNGGHPMRSKSCSKKHTSDSKDSPVPGNKMPNANLPVWTSYVRSFCISTLEKTSGLNRSVSSIQYGFVHKKEGKILLNFTKDVDKKKLVLCIKQNSHSLKENKISELNLLVYIGAVVAAFMVIVVMLIITSIFWRRRKPKLRHNRNNIPHYDNPVSFIENASYNCVVDTVDIKGDNKLDGACQRLNHKNGQTCHVSVKSKKGSPELAGRNKEPDVIPSAYDVIDDVIRETGLRKESDNPPFCPNTVHNYYVLEKQDAQSKYDIARFSKQTCREPDVNIYNKLAIGPEKTYDHAFQTKPNICPASAGAYDTIIDVHSSTTKED